MRQKTSSPNNPSFNPNDVYPEVKIPQSNHSQSAPFNNNSKLSTIFSAELLSFLIGLVSVTLVGAIFGATYNEALISHSQQAWGIFGDYFSIGYAFPVPLAIFIVIAIITRNPLYIFYPIAAFFAAEIIYTTPTVGLLAGYLPIQEPDKHTFFNGAFITVTASYAILYPGIKTFWSFIIYSNNQYNEQKLKAISNAIILGVFYVLLLIAYVASTPLYTEQQRERAAVRIPNTSSIYGDPRHDYQIYYNKIDNPKSDVSTDQVFTNPLEKWWERDTKINCGNQIIYSTSYSGAPKANLAYKTTKNNIVYAEAYFLLNSSNPPMSENKYKEYHYCFVIDNQKYTLKRVSKSEPGQIKRYPAEFIIDTIAGSKKYYPSCSINNKFIKLTYFSEKTPYNKITPFYCTKNDNKNNLQLAKRVIIN